MHLHGCGRFLQEDPIWFAASDLNVHCYVWNNPVNWNDPSGLAAVGRAGVGVIATATAAGLTQPSIFTLFATTAVRQGSRYVVQEVARKAVESSGLGCSIGLTLSQLALTISGASTFEIDSGGCSIVLPNKEKDGEGEGGGSLGGGITDGLPEGKRTGKGTRIFTGSITATLEPDERKFQLKFPVRKLISHLVSFSDRVCHVDFNVNVRGGVFIS